VVCGLGGGYDPGMARTISQIRATEAALGKLGARGISEEEAEQLLNNAFVIVRNLRGRAPRDQPSERRTLIGRTDGGRTLTLVIEQTVEPTSWLIITGWTATERERKILAKG
jgi:uncharacterized DUF497 family protein